MDQQQNQNLSADNSAPLISNPSVIGDFSGNCHYCSRAIPVGAPFCPYCGQQLISSASSVGLGAQIWLYFGSVFMVPFFLGRTIRHIQSPDPKTKTVGYISLALTLISVCGALIYIFYSLNQLNSLYQSAGSRY